VAQIRGISGQPASALLALVGWRLDVATNLARNGLRVRLRSGSVSAGRGARKETWQNNKPWDRRAIIWAGSILPEDERKAWLGKVADIGDDLDATVALTAIVADESSL